MSRKVCVVTGTRAEFGLLRRLMECIDRHPDLILQVVVGGMHLSPEFGLTYKEIEDAGFVIDAKVEMLLSSDSSLAVTKSMGIGVLGFADAYSRLSPDVVVVLGEIVHQALPVQLIGFEQFHMFEVPTHEVSPQADVGSYVYGHTTTLAEPKGYLTLSLLILVAVGSFELLRVVCLR